MRNSSISILNRAQASSVFKIKCVAIYIDYLGNLCIRCHYTRLRRGPVFIIMFVVVVVVVVKSSDMWKCMWMLLIKCVASFAL